MTLGPLIGQGRTAEIFAWSSGQVLKLYKAGYPAWLAEREAQCTRVAYQAGAPAPAVAGVVEVEGRPGIAMERIDGPSMFAQIQTKPWALLRFARRLAELQAAIHRCAAPGLPPLRARLERRIQGLEELLPATKRALLGLLAGLPDGDRLCHGDLHPDNLILSPRGLVVIDWMDATRGHPLADAARTSLMLRQAALPPDTRARALIEAARDLFWRLYLRHYCRLTYTRPADLLAWEAPVAAARLDEGITEEKERLARFVETALRGNPR